MYIYPGHSFHCMRRFICVSDVSSSLQQFSETTGKVWKFEAENHCFLVLRDSFVRRKIIDPWQIVLQNISGPIANFHSKSLISLSSSSGSLSLWPSLSDICDPRDPWEPNRLIGVWVLFRSCLDADWVEWRSFWNASISCSSSMENTFWKAAVYSSSAFAWNNIWPWKKQLNTVWQMKKKRKKK